MATTVINGYNTTAQVVTDTLLIGPDGILVPASGAPFTIAANYGSVIIQGTVIGDSSSDGFHDVTVLVGEGGLVAGTYAIQLEGSSNTLENHGTINADNWAAAVWGYGAKVVNHGSMSGEAVSGSYSTVSIHGEYAHVINTGSIVGGDYAVNIGGTNTRVTNSGLIDNGIYSWADTAEIVNHGTIDDRGTALTLSYTTSGAATGTVTVFNDGTITGGTTAIDVSAVAGRNAQVVNAGLIRGDIDLGNGQDLYDGRQGELFGTVRLWGGDDAAFGGVTAETMQGGDGFDRIEGQGGDDELWGDAGDDTLDGGDGADTIVGGAGDDEIDAGAGNDWVIGQAGADVMDGGLGLDTLAYLGSAAAVNISLATGTAAGGDAQNDIIQNFERIFGSSHNDTMVGSAGVDTLNGFLGDDQILGGSGNDQLRGREGNDTLEGGLGKDALWGDAGLDSFRFGSVADSTFAAGGRDMVFGFVQGEDYFDLAAIDAGAAAGDQAFAWLGTAAFTGAGAELRYAQINGNTFVTADVNGDKAADFSFLVAGTHTLAAGDFVL